MSEEIDKHVLRKYEIQQKLGKGVRVLLGDKRRSRELTIYLVLLSGRRLMA